jgi:hypothetical protein
MDWDCVLAALSEMLGVAGAAALVAFLVERGLKGLTEEAAKHILVRILKSLGKRILPGLALVWILWDIYQLIEHCF